MIDLITHWCDEPGEDDGPREWTCPECGQIWDRMEEHVDEDDPNSEVIEVWYQPREVG